MEPDFVEEDASDDETSEDGSEPTSNFAWKSSTMPVLWRDQDGEMTVRNVPVKLNIFQKMWYRCFPPKPIPKLPPEETMKIVFQNVEQLKTFTAKQETLKNLIFTASANGQTALVEDLKNKEKVMTYEDALIVLGYDRFITEEALVKVAKKSNKAYKLDWIKNFVRIIPPEVAGKKLELDKSLIFDNYAVLHYDPDGKGNKLTQAEIEAKRDPILFGLISGSRRLYFVGDWIDSLCTLTFEELLKEMEMQPQDPQITLKSGEGFYW